MTKRIATQKKDMILEAGVNPIETIEYVWKALHDGKLIRTYCMFF
jgi:sialic acid synthase SpsE